MSDKTMVYNVEELDNYMITETLINVKSALDEKGYNGINQIVGYLLSGDLAYISSYKDARKKIGKLEREKIIEALLKNYLKDIEF
jgi:Uncharacterized protein conserved in bacteria